MNDVDKKKILIVEDDNHLNRMMSYLFQSQVYSVEIATSGSDALETLKNFTPHIIILDLLMPNMDGFEFLKIIKEDASLKDIPVVVLSALPSYMNKDKVLSIGASDYINKPFQSAELVSRINKLMEEKYKK